MEILSLIKAIEGTFSFSNSSLSSWAVTIAKSYASIIDNKYLASDRNWWHTHFKKRIIKGKADLLCVIKETMIFGREHLQRNTSSEKDKFIELLYNQIYNNNQFNTDALYFMTYASRFEDLYFGFDYSIPNCGRGFDDVQILAKQWYYDAAWYLAKQIYNDLMLNM